MRDAMRERPVDLGSRLVTCLRSGGSPYSSERWAKTTLRTPHNGRWLGCLDRLTACQKCARVPTQTPQRLNRLTDGRNCCKSRLLGCVLSRGEVRWGGVGWGEVGWGKGKWGGVGWSEAASPLRYAQVCSGMLGYVRSVPVPMQH